MDNTNQNSSQPAVQPPASATPPPASTGQPQPTQASAPQPTNGQPTQPGQQNGQPSAQQPTNPQGNQPPANQPPQPHDIFKSILKTLNGGPIYVTAPDGSRQEVQQTKGQLGRSILAGALAGLFTPNQYRTGYKGAQVLDRGNTIAAAGQAGMQMKEAQQQRAQQISDEQQTKKLMTLQNNAKQVQLSAAMAHEKMSALDDTLAYNQKNLIDPLEDFEKNLPPGEPSIYVAKGLTADQVLAKDPQTGQPAHKLTDGNVFISGKVTKPDAQGVLESEPTYSIVRNDFSVKLPEATTQELAKFDKRFDNAYKATNGNVMLPINTYLDRIHVANELTATEDFLDRVNRQINGDNAKPIDLAAAYRKNPPALQPAIDAMTQARAAGQARGEGTDDQVIRAIWNANNGTKLLSLIGDPTAVAKWGQNQENERISKQALAKEGGIGDKVPISQTQQKAIVAAASQLKDPTDRQSILAQIPTDRPLTTMEAERISNHIATANDKQKEADLKQGDPVELQKQANNMIEGDFTSVRDLVNARSNIRTQFNNLIQDEARKRGLDPTKYTLESQQARADMYKDYSGASTKTGQQLVSFNTFLSHVGEAVDANQNWVRSNSPLVNKPLSWLAKNATDDQDYKRFVTSVIAPAKEYMNFLNAGHAEHTEDVKAMDNALDGNQTPAQILTALQTFAKTADARAANLGQKYVQTVGTTYPVVTSQSVDTLNRLLGKGNSQAAKVSVALPRGWQNNTATQMNPNDPRMKAIVNQFVAAAGGDADLAKSLLKQNGWK